MTSPIFPPFDFIAILTNQNNIKNILKKKTNMKPPESIKINKISDVITITYEIKINGRRLPRRDVHESEMFPMTGFIKARDNIKIPNIERTLFGNPKAIIYNTK